MAVFTPPHTPPAILESAPPRYGRVPVHVRSHHYDYIVTGNTLLPPKLIEATIAKVIGPDDAISALLKQYHRYGFVLVAVTAQVKSNKHVEIAIIEGMVTDQKIPEPLRAYFPNSLNRVNLQQSDLTRDQIMASTFAARSGHDITVNLSPAPNPGGSALTIDQTKIAGYSPISALVNFGNYGSRYASGYIAGGQVNANLGQGVAVNANFTQGIPGLRRVSLGSNYYTNGVGISVVRPYGIYGFNANWTHFRLGKSTYPLNPDANIFTYQFTGSQLLYAGKANRVTLNESFNHVRYIESVFNGFETLLDQHYNYLSGGVSASHAMSVFGESASLQGSFNFNLGISAPYGTLFDNVRGAPTSHFRYTVMSLEYEQSIPHGMSLELSGNAQWSPNTLPSQQQWVLGGLGNLSAWEPGTVIGDSGYVARLQLNAPTFQRWGGAAKLGAYIETGGATNANPSPGTAPWQTLSDVGLILTLTLPHEISIKALAAHPIHSGGYTQSGITNLRSNRVNAFFVIQKGF
ncbi:ShlB/FhaC/HecB family hemolysin secretion/activation protein [Acidiphilium sp. 37-64-53]|uniref:ShlB/FhaC/HecB family hemolysin secretion/activation protein n=1 Tax=Acidiphilium sp. 37-64-53 TaxID=1970299 RepID=UPI00257AFA7B|nr:ShlB/FhaC/HecB family hemolysin secretion/activation protein [Acidiphilium sp. 37-64-53]